MSTFWKTQLDQAFQVSIVLKCTIKYTVCLQIRGNKVLPHGLIWMLCKEPVYFPFVPPILYEVPSWEAVCNRSMNRTSWVNNKLALIQSLIRLPLTSSPYPQPWDSSINYVSFCKGNRTTSSHWEFCLDHKGEGLLVDTSPSIDMHCPPPPSTLDTPVDRYTPTAQQEYCGRSPPRPPEEAKGRLQTTEEERLENEWRTVGEIVHDDRHTSQL